MMTKLIIPCAGLGKRMNMKINESKELLISPYTAEPLIEYSLRIAQIFGFDPLVVTRKEKTDLIEYCKEHKIEFQIIEPKGEWANTVLASAKHWEENNILILPDTEFEEMLFVPQLIQDQLDLGCRYSIAYHEVGDISNWGAIKDYTITEKPKDEGKANSKGDAWGLIGFKKKYGKQLFKAMTKKNRPFKLKDTGFVKLIEFKDLTRTGKIE